MLNLPGTFYCLMYLFIFLGEGGFLFSDLFAEKTDSFLYLFGAVLGIAAILYFLRDLSLIRKRLRFVLRLLSPPPPSSSGNESPP